MFYCLAAQSRTVSRKLDANGVFFAVFDYFIADVNEAPSATGNDD